MKTRKTMFGIMAIVAIVTLAFIASCNNGDDKTHTHQWGAYEVTKAPTVTAEGEETSTCATCGEKQTRPIPQLVSCNCAATYGELTHLEEGETCTCPGVNCTGCLPKVSAMSSDGKIKIIKEVGVSTNDFNTAVNEIDGSLDFFSGISNNITEARVGLAETGISHQGKVLFIGCDEDKSTIIPYLGSQGLLGQIQQSKVIYMVMQTASGTISI
jgi:hypothetical protein